MRLEKMIDELKKAILQGTLKHGDYIPSERELCDTYQLSKNTVRKGLDELVSDGLIQKIPRIGSQVTVHTNSTIRRETTTIRFAYYPSMVEETNILHLVKQFNHMNPDIYIQAIPFTFPNDSEGLHSIFNEIAFDIMTFNLYDYNVLQTHHMDSQFLEPIALHPDNFSFVNDAYSTDPTKYIAPFVFTPVFICYNKDHFKKKGLPLPQPDWTWDQMRSIAHQLSIGENRLGFYMRYASDNRWPILLLQHEIAFHREANGRYVLGRQDIIEIFQQYKQLMTGLTLPNSSVEKESDVEYLFINEGASMIMATYSTLNAFKEIPFEYDIVPLPVSATQHSLLVSMGMCLHRNSIHKSTAQKFIDYLTSYETQLYIRQHTMSLPCNQAAAEWNGTEYIARPQNFDLFRKIIHDIRSFKTLNLTTEQIIMMRNELRYYWSDLRTLDEVLKRLEHTYSCITVF